MGNLILNIFYLKHFFIKSVFSAAFSPKVNLLSHFSTAWAKSASDKNFEILLKNYFLLKNFYNHRLCWNNCPPLIAWRASNRRIIFSNTRLQVFSSMFGTCASISVFNSFTVVGSLRYTLFFKYAHKVRRSQIGISRWPRALRYDPIFKKFS